MARLRLTPQKREFFDLYSQASANAVEISRLLVDLLEQTFVTPFDRDDMNRLAGAIDDVCDNIDEAADNLGVYGALRVPDGAREQAKVILRAAIKLDEAVNRLEGFRDSKQQLIEL